jgi:hypothetical protein
MTDVILAFVDTKALACHAVVLLLNSLDEVQAPKAVSGDTQDTCPAPAKT